jgi:Flp pilus assembly protein TadG
MSALSNRFLCLSRRLRHDCRGLAAVEFAFILPLMLMLTFAMIETTDGIAIDRKTDITAHTLSDLIAAIQPVGGTAVTVTDNDIRDAFVASTSIMIPYSASVIEATISQIKIDAAGNATVVWSKGWANSALTTGRQTGAVTLQERQQGLLTPNTYLIWSEVKYYYSPKVPYLMQAGFLKPHEGFSRPRYAPCVSYGATNCAS